MRRIVAIATFAVIAPLLIRSEMTVPGQTADLEKKNLEVIRRSTEAENRHDLDVF